MKLPESMRQLLDSEDSNNHFLVKEMITHMNITMYDIIYYMVFESKNWNMDDHLLCKLIFNMEINISIHYNKSEIFGTLCGVGNEFMVFDFTKDEGKEDIKLNQCINNIIKEIENE